MTDAKPVWQLRATFVASLLILALLQYFSYNFVRHSLASYDDYVGMLKGVEAGEDGMTQTEVIVLTQSFWKRIATELRQHQQTILISAIVTLLFLGAAVFEPMVRIIRRQIEQLERHQRDLSDARIAAEEASRLKSSFLANMSHEIRTPMNGVLGMAELLLRTDLNQQQREYLESAKWSAESLLTLLNDLLDFSKIEAGKMELEEAPFDLRDCLSMSVRSLDVKASEKKLALSLVIADNVPHNVTGDTHRLRQVLVNLIGNAIKFTEPGGRIEVHARLAATDPQGVDMRFEVRDTGIGIPPDKQQAIFESFSQAETSTSRRYGGTGLGLAICSQLVSLMHGRISVESTPGSGSTFSFSARFGLAQQLASSARPDKRQRIDAPHPQTAPARKILVADDSLVNQRIACGLLEAQGHKVVAVGDGQAALLQLDKDSFDLVLMDLTMPELDGIEAAKEIRRREGAGRRIPIIAMTASIADEDRQQSLEAGMDGHLCKPFKPAELFDVIEKHTQSSELNPSIPHRLAATKEPQ